MKKSYILIEEELIDATDTTPPILRRTVRQKLWQRKSETVLYHKDTPLLPDAKFVPFFIGFLRWIDEIRKRENTGDFKPRDLDEEIRIQITSGEFDDEISEMEAMIEEKVKSLSKT